MDERKWWIFTFGYGQEHQGCYVRIYGTYGGARDKMFAKYGDKWAFQHDEDSFNKFFEEHPTVPKEMFLEVVE